MKIKNKALAFVCAALVLLGAACGCGSEVQNVSGGDVVSSSSAENEQPRDPINQVADSEVRQYSGYSLLWHDEFNGTELDKNIWNRETRKPGWVNNELQSYNNSDKNVFIRDGRLVLKAIASEDNFGTKKYASGKVNSQDKTDFLYGKVVVSARVPEGKGLWPAIWMMPTRESYYGTWPKCGEIDIMEILGHQTDTAYSTIHYGEPHGSQQGSKVLTDGSSFSDSFHEFGVEWEPGEMRFYIDEELILTCNDWVSGFAASEPRPYPAPFDQTFFVQMNLAVGGDWPGNPDETTDFEKAEFEIDYVRVYQKPEYDTNVTRPTVNVREPEEDGNYLINGDFAVDEALNDEVAWKFMLFNGGEGSAEIEDKKIIITTQNEGTVDYSIQLVQADVPLVQGEKYRVTFDARAEEARDMIVCISGPSAGYVRYMQDTKVELTTKWKTYSYEFTMNEKTDAMARLEYNMGKAGSTAEINITNVVVEKLS